MIRLTSRWHKFSQDLSSICCPECCQKSEVTGLYWRYLPEFVFRASNRLTKGHGCPHWLSNRSDAGWLRFRILSVECCREIIEPLLEIG